METDQLFILALVVSSSLQGGMKEQSFNYFTLFFFFFQQRDVAPYITCTGLGPGQFCLAGDVSVRSEARW